MPQFKVLRKFSGHRPFEVGESIILDGPNLEKLVSQRYIAPDAGPLTAAPTKAGKPARSQSPTSPQPEAKNASESV